MPELSQKEIYTVILPNGVHHEMPLPFFWYYTKMKLIRVSQKHSNVARLQKGVRAFPDYLSHGGLRFEVVYRDKVVRFAPPNIWNRLISLSMVQEPELYDEMWKFYRRISDQFAA